MLDNFVEVGFLVIDNCFETDFLQALQAESGMLDYQEAKLTHGERASEIRGDSTRWIESAQDCPIGMQYLQAIEALGQFFNQTLYAGIRQVEAHYARYPVGYGYQWHTDNPQGRYERVISAVFYLNENWCDKDGGEISLYDKQGNRQILFPQANRLIVFDSNLRHQVEITKRIRFSIATWLRQD